jgi:Ca-activated chloride channel family protein
MINDWLQNIEFKYPMLLGLVLLLPVLVYEHFRKRKRMESSMLITTTHFIESSRNIKTSLIHLPFMLRMLAFVCLIVALALPRKVFTGRQTEGEGIDIVLCFDISGSMTEQDFQPNRLEAAKTVAAKFVEQRPGDRIGSCYLQ